MDTPPRRGRAPSQGWPGRRVCRGGGTGRRLRREVSPQSRPSACCHGVPATGEAGWGSGTLRGPGSALGTQTASSLSERAPSTRVYSAPGHGIGRRGPTFLSCRSQPARGAGGGRSEGHTRDSGGRPAPRRRRTGTRRATAGRAQQQTGSQQRKLGGRSLRRGAIAGTVAGACARRRGREDEGAHHAEQSRGVWGPLARRSVAGRSLRTRPSQTQSAPEAPRFYCDLL